MTALDSRPVERVAPVPVATPALYDVRIAHTRTAPLRNSFEYAGYLWLVDLDDVAVGRLVQGRPLPRWLRSQARFDAADHLGDPGASIRTTSSRSRGSTGSATSTGCSCWPRPAAVRAGRPTSSTRCRRTGATAPTAP